MHISNALTGEINVLGLHLQRMAHFEFSYPHSFEFRTPR